jgi:Mg-chelatase subunit ChlD
MPTLARARFIPLLLLTTSFGVTSCSRAGDEGATRTTTTTREVSVAGIVKTKTETTTTEPVSAEEPSDQPIASARPQAGLLTAGDQDDLLNADSFAKYAGRFLQSHGGKLPFVDPRSRIPIKVVDASGRPVPFARIDVSRGSAPLHLVAAADGTASIYPALDKLPRKTTLRVESTAGAATRTIEVSAKGQPVAIQLPGAARPPAAMDLVLVIDTTGSMSDELTYLQAELDSVIERVRRNAGNVDLRVGVIVYRDEGDDYVVKSAPLTADIGSVGQMLDAQQADGGGDEPEAVDQAMAAAGRMQWRPDAAKALLFVADAPPHEEAMAATFAAAEKLRSRGVQIVPVAASGVEDSAQYVMRSMAALTQGRYIFLTDDSGVGNPHAEPDLACYVVTRLDQLIGRVLAGIAEGRRIEPAQGEVIRTVGRYDRGRCLAGASDQS